MPQIQAHQCYCSVSVQHAAQVASKTCDGNCVLVQKQHCMQQHLMSAATAFRNGHPACSYVCQLSSYVAQLRPARRALRFRAVSERPAFDWLDTTLVLQAVPSVTFSMSWQSLSTRSSLSVTCHRLRLVRSRHCKPWSNIR